MSPFAAACDFLRASFGECKLQLRNGSLSVSQAIPRGHVILTVPRHLSLESKRAEREELRAVATNHPHVVVPPFMLALSLIYHDAHGKRSRFHPLIEALPTEAQLRRLPLFMPTKALRRLSGTDAHSLATDLVAELEETYRTEVLPITTDPQMGFPGDAPSLARWRWALAVTWRCGVSLGDERVLLPLLCPALHAPASPSAPVEASADGPRGVDEAFAAGVEVRRGEEEGEIGVWAAEELAAGAELRVDFGGRSNSELIVARGEALPYNSRER